MYHGTAGNETTLKRFCHALLNSRDIFLGHHAANYFVLEDVWLIAANQRLNLQPNVGELAVPTTLFLVAPFSSSLLLYGLSVGYLAIMLDNVDTVTPLHTLYGNID